MRGLYPLFSFFRTRDFEKPILSKVVEPCRRALRRITAFPSGVLGPVVAGILEHDKKRDLFWATKKRINRNKGSTLSDLGITRDQSSLAVAACCRSIRSLDRRSATFLVYANENRGPGACLAGIAKAAITLILAGMETEWTGPPPSSPALFIGGSVPASALSFEELGARAAAFARNSRVPATDRAYRSDWRDFEGWCCRAGLTPLPAAPATIGAYLADRADDLKVSSLARKVAAIAAAHRLAGYRLDRSHPAIAAVLAGIRRRFGSRQEAKAAILTPELRRMVRAQPVFRLCPLCEGTVQEGSSGSCELNREGVCKISILRAVNRTLLTRRFFSGEMG
jgi:hypothetical protein